MHPRMMNPFMDVTCIARKKNPILVSWTNQVTPSESSIIKRVGYEPLFLRFLKNELGIKSVLRVAMHEPLTNLRKVIVVQMKKPTEAETWRALMGAATFHPGVGKFLVAVDEDIDPWDMDLRLAATTSRSRRAQPLNRRSSSTPSCATLSRRSLYLNENTWKGRKRFGKSWAFRRSLPRRRGTAIPSAIGMRSWRKRPGWPCKEIISAMGRN